MASTIGGTSNNRKGISEIKVHTKVVKAPANGTGATASDPGKTKNWLHPQTPNPIMALPIKRLTVETTRYLLMVYSFIK